MLLVGSGVSEVVWGKWRFSSSFRFASHSNCKLVPVTNFAFEYLILKAALLCFSLVKRLPLPSLAFFFIPDLSWDFFHSPYHALFLFVWK